MRILGYFTFKDLYHDRWRSLLTVISLAVIVFAFLLLSSLSQTFRTFGVQTQITNNLVIIEKDVIDPQESSLDGGILTTAMDIAPTQILRAFPVIFRHMNIEGRILQVRGVPLDEMPIAMGLSLVQGAWPTGPNQVVIGEEIARTASWKIGSSINIYGTNFQVTGLVRSGENNYGVVWMTYSEGVSLFGTLHGFQVAYLPLAASMDPEKVRIKLQDDPRIGADNTVYLENSVGDSYHQANHNLVTLSAIMGIISLLSITFGVYNFTSLSLIERSREVSLLRLVGFSPGTLGGFLAVRALLLTLVAYWIGWIASFVFNTYQNTHSQMAFSEVPLTLRLTPLMSLTGLGLACAFSFVGIWLTTRQLGSANLLPSTE